MYISNLLISIVRKKKEDKKNENVEHRQENKDFQIVLEQNNENKWRKKKTINVYMIRFFSSSCSL